MRIVSHICLIHNSAEQRGGQKMFKNKKQVLEQERESLLNQWIKKDGNKTKLLLRIMELDDKIEMLKKGA